MSVPDGEYDIDLLELDFCQELLVALRYGFIPDSMDQTKPLTLFMTDLACVLEAPLVGKAGAPLLPIIFEGLPQRQRPAPGGSLDSFYLAVGGGKAKLQRLLNTVRVNKSRNAEKWRADIAVWRDNVAETRKNGGLSLPAVLLRLLLPDELPKPARQGDVLPRAASSGVSVGLQMMLQNPLKSVLQNPLKSVLQNPLKSVLQNPLKPALQNPLKSAQIPLKSAQNPLKSAQIPLKSAQIPLQSAGSAQHATKRTNARNSVFRASSRNDSRKVPVLRKPASKRPPTSPEPKNDIISASDFEDLDAEGPSPDTSRSRARNELEDDFKDLEDQLQEVLEEPNMSDSDDSEFAPIIIQVNEERPRSARDISQRDSSLKPMSLRELYGGGRNDDLSSSEEE